MDLRPLLVSKDVLKITIKSTYRGDGFTRKKSLLRFSRYNLFRGTSALGLNFAKRKTQKFQKLISIFIVVYIYITLRNFYMQLAQKVKQLAVKHRSLVMSWFDSICWHTFFLCKNAFLFFIQNCVFYTSRNTYKHKYCKVDEVHSLQRTCVLVTFYAQNEVGRVTDLKKMGVGQLDKLQQVLQFLLMSN